MVIKSTETTPRRHELKLALGSHFVMMKKALICLTTDFFVCVISHSVEKQSNFFMHQSIESDCLLYTQNGWVGNELYQLNRQNAVAGKESFLSSIEQRSNMECIKSKHTQLQVTMTSATSRMSSHIPTVVLAGLYFSSAGEECGSSWDLLLFSS